MSAAHAYTIPLETRESLRQEPIEVLAFSSKAPTSASFSPLTWARGSSKLPIRDDGRTNCVPSRCLSAHAMIALQTFIFVGRVHILVTNSVDVQAPELLGFLPERHGHI